MAALGGFYGSIRRVLLYRLTLAKPLSNKGLKKILPRIFNITRPKTKTSPAWLWSQAGFLSVFERVPGLTQLHHL